MLEHITEVFLLLKWPLLWFGTDIKGLLQIIRIITIALISLWLSIHGNPLRALCRIFSERCRLGPLLDVSRWLLFECRGALLLPKAHVAKDIILINGLGRLMHRLSLHRLQRLGCLPWLLVLVRAQLLVAELLQALVLFVAH